MGPYDSVGAPVTGTLVGKFFISCHHVFRPALDSMQIDFHLNLNTTFDGKYRKSLQSFLLSAPAGFTNHACYHELCDVAVGVSNILENKEHQLMPFGRILLNNNPWRSGNSQAQQDLIGRAVKKVGCTIGVTGKIVEIVHNHLTISCDTLGKFVANGDSGSLVLDAASNAVVGIVKSVNRNYDFAYCIPVWSFYDWFYRLEIMTS